MSGFHLSWYDLLAPWVMAAAPLSTSSTFKQPQLSKAHTSSSGERVSFGDRAQAYGGDSFSSSLWRRSGMRRGLGVRLHVEQHSKFGSGPKDCTIRKEPCWAKPLWARLRPPGKRELERKRMCCTSSLNCSVVVVLTCCDLTFDGESLSRVPFGKQPLLRRHGHRPKERLFNKHP